MFIKYKLINQTANECGQITQWNTNKRENFQMIYIQGTIQYFGKRKPNTFYKR